MNSSFSPPRCFILEAIALLALFALAAAGAGCVPECGLGRKAADGACVLDAFLGADAWNWRQTELDYGAVLDRMASDGIGVRVIGLDSVNWESMEPEPPGAAGHGYDFRALDAAVETAVERGFTLDIGVNCRSPWATEKKLGQIGDNAESCCDMSPPKPDSECLPAYGTSCSAAWADFVRALVERYDGDADVGCRPEVLADSTHADDCYRLGDGQMPGFVLVRPAIQTFQAGNEPEARDHFWAGLGDVPAEEAAARYDEILAPAFRAAKEGSASLFVLRGKSNPGMSFDDLWEEPLAAADGVVRARRPGFLEFVETSLAVSRDRFDGVAINYNDHYTGLIAYAPWLRDRMRALGYEKPLVVADARPSLYPRGNDDPSKAVLPPYYPAGLIECLAQPDACSTYDENEALFQADKVRQTVRKIAVALATGQRMISLQPIVDFHDLVPLWVESGLMGTDRALSGDVSSAREPVYWAIGQLATFVIGGDPEVETLAVGPDVFAYRWTREGGRFWIVWHEDPRRVDPVSGLVEREQSVTVNLSSYARGPGLLLRRFVTSLDASRSPVFPAPEVVSAAEISIDETPVLLEEL